ncbi:facilitated trehalose transporter Tret1-2 homolog [Neocloeon triangulifer]|uniref:facilitated trehalose transporter Tret1-2 homolog n=1 Tax=Neocloeon triangulifer TaxID=2078957 RepID=UPI00286F1F86|nr:facilitated trehalose transporter Tret1-2 homolog [Neocloeon triangulifer]
MQSPNKKQQCEDEEEEGPMLNLGEVKTTIGKVKSVTDLTKDSNSKAYFAQSLVAGAVFLLTAGCGMPIGFSAILLPQLQTPNSTIPTSEETGSWIASIHSASTPIGSLLSGTLMENWGRRNTLRLSVLPFLIGWTVLALAGSHLFIFIGRLFCGLAVGLAAAPSQVLLGEVAEPKLRGLLVGAPFASYSLGILIVYTMGSMLPWKIVAGLCAILPACALLALMSLPESPPWLAKVGRSQEALRALTWLRGGQMAQARSELAVLAARRDQEEQHALAKQKKRRNSWFNTWRQSPLFSRVVLKPLIVVNVFNVVQILSGTYTIIFYAVDVLQQAEGGDETDQVAELETAVLTALVRTVITAFACLLLLKVGRRPLAISSGLGSAAAAVALGCWLYVAPPPGTLSWLPATLVLLYVGCNTYGFFVLPGLMMGEMLPARARGPAGGLTFAVINITLFVTTKVYPWAVHVLHPHGLFFFFGICALLGTLFVYLFVPETKGRTLSEIEDYFSGTNLIWQTRVKEQQDSDSNKV